MTLVNLPRFYKGVTIVPAIFKEDSIFPTLLESPIEEATAMFKSMILTDEKLLDTAAHVKDNRLAVIVALQQLPGRRINMLNIGWIWHSEDGTLTPISLPMTIKKATLQDSNDKNVTHSVWSIKVPLAKTPIAMLGYPESTKYVVQEVVTYGLSNVLVFKSTNPEFFEGSIVKNTEDSEDEDEDFLADTDLRPNDGSVVQDEEEHPMEVETVPPVVDNNSNVTSQEEDPVVERIAVVPSSSGSNQPSTNKRKHGDPPSPNNTLSSYAKKGSAAKKGGGGDPNPRNGNNNRADDDPTHKLDGPDVYRTTLNRIDETARLFNGFFARFFHNEILTDMNRAVYREVSSFDAVHVLNHGAHMIKASTLTPNPAIVAAFTTAETLMPEIPNARFLELAESQLAVRRYGTAIFSQAGIGNVRQLSSFFNDLSNTGPNSLYRDMQLDYQQHAPAADQAFDFNTIRKNLTIDAIANLAENSDDLLPLNLVMRLVRDYLTWKERADAGNYRRERMELFYSIHMGVARMGRASPRQCRKYANELTQILGTDVALDGSLISTVWRYNKPFISEQSAFRFFSRLRTFVSEEDAVHFHHMFLYAAHQEMSCMKFITQAIRQFPDFPWYLARSSFRADWNAFESVNQEMWNRPYMAYTGIEARFGSQNYKSLAYLAWCLIIHFGSTRDVAAKGYSGFKDPEMPTSIKRKVEELLRYYQNNVVISIDLSREYTIEERRTVFDQMESNVQKYAHAAKLFDDRLQTMDGSEDLIQISNQCLVQAQENVNNIRELQLLPIRRSNRDGGQQQQFQLDNRNREGEDFNF